MGFTTSFKFNFKSNLEAVKGKISGNIDHAFDELSEQSVGWVQDKMMKGYNEPHGRDGHTAIYDTGALHDSIDAKVTSKIFILHKVEVGSPLDYAVFVHNGTRKLHGRPFIRDAMEENKNKFAEIIQSALKE